MEYSGRLLSSEEVALLMGIQPKTLATWRATKRYELPYVKVGRSVRYRLKDLEDFINERLVSTNDTGGNQYD